MNKNSLFSIKDRVVIVTGGTKGIGKAIAKGLSNEGAIVYSLGRSCNNIDISPNLFCRKCDITDYSEFEEFCKLINRKHSNIYALINNAGTTITKGENETYKDSDWDKTMEVNLKAAFNCIQTAGSYMLKKGEGSIINITSIGAELGFPNNPAYIASKGGLKMLTKAFARDWGRKGIRCNNIGPGYMLTDMTQKSYNNPEKKLQRNQNIMIGRWGEPEDLIGPCIFLISDASKYITGQDIYVDGGWMANGLPYED